MSINTRSIAFDIENATLFPNHGDVVVLENLSPELSLVSPKPPNISFLSLKQTTFVLYDEKIFGLNLFHFRNKPATVLSFL